MGFYLLQAMLVNSGTALGNGGPVAWTGRTARDGIAPLARTDVSLVSEDLRLTIEPDGSASPVFEMTKRLRAGGPAAHGLNMEAPSGRCCRRRRSHDGGRVGWRACLERNPQSGEALNNSRTKNRASCLPVLQIGKLDLL